MTRKGDSEGRLGQAQRRSGGGPARSGGGPARKRPTRPGGLCVCECRCARVCVCVRARVRAHTRRRRGGARRLIFSEESGRKGATGLFFFSSAGRGDRAGRPAGFDGRRRLQPSPGRAAEKGFLFCMCRAAKMCVCVCVCACVCSARRLLGERDALFDGGVGIEVLQLVKERLALHLYIII